MRQEIPKATVARLPVYLQCLNMLPPDETVVSSDALATLARVTPAQVRKDLSYVATRGVRGVGYERDDLRTQLRAVLGLDHEASVVIVGVGNLGAALANYKGFAGAGFSIVAIYDSDPAKIGRPINGYRIRPMGDLAADVARFGVTLAMLATSAEGAQSAAELCCEAGIESILNFAPTMLRVPEGIRVRKVDLATELQILAYYAQGPTGTEAQGTSRMESTSEAAETRTP